MLEHASKDVRHAITRAAAEAAARGDRRIATDHLLLGLLHEPTVAARLGTTLERAREVAVELDRIALRAIGIDLRHEVAAGQPSGSRNGVVADVAFTRGRHEARTGHMPLSRGARQALTRAFTIAKSERQRAVQTQHLVAALRERTEPDPAAALCRALSLSQPSPP